MQAVHTPTDTAVY